MSAETENIESLDSQGVIDLEYTRDLRKKLLDKLIMKDGALAIPGESSEKIMVMQLLDGTDKQVMGRAKLRASEKASKVNENMTAVIAQALKDLNVNTYVPPADESQRSVTTERSKPFVPGEGDVGVEPVSISQIMQPTKG